MSDVRKVNLEKSHVGVMWDSSGLLVTLDIRNTWYQFSPEKARKIAEELVHKAELTEQHNQDNELEMLKEKADKYDKLVDLIKGAVNV